MYTIYCHIFPNQKRYVGMTKTSMNKRWRNGKNYSTCPLVHRAIMKYGWENISHEILATVSTLSEAESKERYYIKLYDTQNPIHGYNVLPGGDVANNSATPEMRYKLGNGWRGKHRSEDEKEKISQGVKQTFSRKESNGHYGLTASDETKQKMSDSQHNRWVDNYELQKQASIRMAERMSDSKYKEKVLQNLSKYRRKAGTWKMPETAKQKLSEEMKGRWIGDKSTSSKPVLQYTYDGNFIRRWSNAGEVERFGIALRSNVSKCCRHVPHVKTASGFKWEFDVSLQQTD